MSKLFYIVLFMTMMMFAAVAASFGAWAETETVGGYTWTYRNVRGRADNLV